MHNQLIVITHEIYKDLNVRLEVRGVFLDIPQAFDKVWHQGLKYKLRCDGISGNLLKIFESFLGNRKQRVVLNGQCSNWASLNVGVNQGLILGPPLLLSYINNLLENVRLNSESFAPALLNSFALTMQNKQMGNPVENKL